MKEWEKIYDNFKKEILSNKYINQKFLPTEKQLCIKYKVSRETIRKVYSKLEKEGVILSIENKGRIQKQVSQNSNLHSFRQLTNNIYRSEYKIISNEEDKLVIEIKRYDQKNKIAIYAISKIYKEFLEEFCIDEFLLNKNGIMHILDNYSKYGISNANKLIKINENEQRINNEILNSKYSILNNCLIFDKFENIIEHSMNYYRPDFFEYKIYENYSKKE